VAARGAHLYQTRVIDDASELVAIEPQWRLLETRASAGWSYYQRADWCLNWLSTMGRDARLHVVTGWAGDRLVAVWPLVVTGGLGLRRLAPIGEALAQYSDALIDADHAGDALAEALVGAALLAPRADVAALPAIPRSSPLACVLLRRLPNSTQIAGQAFQLTLDQYGSPDAYFATLSKLQKRNRNRRRNHLARLGELSFEVVWGGDEGFAGLVEQAVAFKREWLSRARRISVGLSGRGVEAFLGNLDGDAARLEGAMVSVLRLDGQPIAIELGFLVCGHYHAYLGAFDMNLAEHSPGKVQMDMTVNWLIEARARCYDLLANDADYKQAWSNQTETLVSTHHAYTFSGRVYAGFWLGRLRPAIKAGYAQVPQAWRRIVAFGQSFGCLILYV
jgi:CelD/BcsL family acetyltransferase involved in cellulose biosynthesis